MNVRLDDAALARGEALWEQARHCTSRTAPELDALKKWAARHQCGEAQRLLSKTHVQVAANGLLRYVEDTLPQVHTMPMEDRMAQTHNLEMEAVTLFNMALDEAARGAIHNQSLQCFHLACLVAYWVRGRATPFQIQFRVNILHQLQAQWQRWEVARSQGQEQPWSDPAAERIIGERAPFETDARRMSQWLPQAVQVGPAMLAQAASDDAELLHVLSIGHVPESKSLDPRQMVTEPTTPLPMRVSLMDGLIHADARKRFAQLAMQGELKIAGIDRAAPGGALNQKASQALKLSEQQLKLRKQLERRQQEQAAAVCAAGNCNSEAGGGGGSSSGGGVLGRFERPTQEDVRRFLVRRLQQAAAAAATSSGRKSTPVAVAQAALEAVTRVAPPELAASAAEQAQQGVLPPATATRVRELAGKLPQPGAGTGQRQQQQQQQQQQQHVYRWPPSSWLQQAAQRKHQGGQAAGAGEGRVLHECATPASLDGYLEAHLLGPDAPGMKRLVGGLKERLPGLELDSMPRSNQQRVQQALRGLPGVVEPPGVLPQPGSLQLAPGLSSDLAFVKTVLRGRPSARTLLEAIAACAPALVPQGEPAESPRSGVKKQEACSTSVGMLTALDCHTHKTDAQWMPCTEGAVSTSRFFPHCTTDSLLLHVADQGMKVHPGELPVQAVLSRAMLGTAMLRQLQARRQGGGGSPWLQGALNHALQQPLLASPDELLTMLGADEDLAVLLHAAVTEVVAVGGSLGAHVPGLPSRQGDAAIGAGHPPVVQLAAAVVLAEALAQQSRDARINLDWLNEEKLELARRVLLGVEVLQGRGRLTHLAATAMTAFIQRALTEVHSKAQPRDDSLAACLQLVGCLPLVAVAQLAAFVSQLVGRCFLDLADLDPQAFGDLAVLDDLEAEVAPGGNLQLSGRGLADLAAIEGSSGADVQQLLEHTAQSVARYATLGSIAGGGDRAAAAQRRHRRQEGPGWLELLEALQQQTVLNGVLLGLKDRLDAVGTQAAEALGEAKDYAAHSATKAMSLAALDPDKTEATVHRVAAEMQPALQALVPAEHAWCALELACCRAAVRQAAEGEDRLGRQLRPNDPSQQLLLAAREQLRAYQLQQADMAADLEKRMAAGQGAAAVSSKLDAGLAAITAFVERQREQQASGASTVSLAGDAKEAQQALLRFNQLADQALRDVSDMASQLAGLLSCCHIRTQLLLSELRSRCCVHPASELMGLALREVLPLCWQREWSSQQEKSSTQLMAELLEEEEREAQREQRKAAKAARKKAQKKGGDNSADKPSSSTDAAAASYEAAAGSAGDSANSGRRGTVASGTGQVVDSWEELPQSVAKAAAAARGEASPPPEYLRMLRQYEEEERRQQEEAAVAAAGAAPQGQPEQGKKSKEKKGKKGGQEAASSPATEQPEEQDASGWQAVGKKGAVVRPQQPQQAEPPPFRPRQQAPAGAHPQQPPTPPLQQPKEQRPGQHQEQQEQWQQQQHGGGQRQQGRLRPDAGEFSPTVPQQQVSEQSWSPSADQLRRRLSADAQPFAPTAAMQQGWSAAPLLSSRHHADDEFQLPDTLEPSSSPPLVAGSAGGSGGQAEDDDMFSQLLGLGSSAVAPSATADSGSLPSFASQPPAPLPHEQGLEALLPGGAAAHLGGYGAFAASLPLPHQQVLGGLDSASMMQPPLGSGMLPKMDPEIVAAAAAAARLAGTSRLQQPPLLSQQHPALFPLPQQHGPAQRVAVDWSQALQAPGGSPEEDSVDSLMQMLGVPAQDAWAAATAAPPASHLHHQHGGSSASGSLGGGDLLQQPELMAQQAQPPGSFLAALDPQLTAVQQQQPALAQPLAGKMALPGLRNETGEYNCFLNVVIQCLWRCAEFRQLVLSWDGSVTAHNAVARSLHKLFLALRAAQQQQATTAVGGVSAGAGSGDVPVAVNPAELREALAALPNRLFQLGEMSDAGETLLAMFEMIREASPAAAHALDRLFGLHVREAVHCTELHCRKVTHQNAYVQYFYNTRATALRRSVAQAVEDRKLGRLGPKTLGSRLRKIEEQVHKSCDTDLGGCNKTYPVTTRLEQAPRVFSLQIAWQTNCEMPEDIAATLAALDESVDLGEVYQHMQQCTPRYRLRSMVCYYGQHYQALVLVPDAGGWLMFDDTRVSCVGSWADVRRKCEAGRIQPSVLFYEAAG